MQTNEKIRAKMVGLSQTGGLEPITVDQYDDNGTVKKTVNCLILITSRTTIL